MNAVKFYIRKVVFLKVTDLLPYKGPNDISG